MSILFQSTNHERKMILPTGRVVLVKDGNIFLKGVEDFSTGSYYPAMEYESWDKAPKFMLDKVKDKNMDGVVWAGKTFFINKEVMDEALRQKKDIERHGFSENDIPGLLELRRAFDKSLDYKRKFIRMMEDEDDLFIPNSDVDHELKALKNKYPEAVAYLQIDSFCNSNNQIKFEVGNIAKKKVKKVSDIIKIATEMENEYRYRYRMLRS